MSLRIHWAVNDPIGGPRGPEMQHSKRAGKEDFGHFLSDLPLHDDAYSSLYAPS